MLKTFIWERPDASHSAHPNGQFQELENHTLISDHLEAANGLLWVDLTAPTPEEIALMADEFQLHPLAVEDATKQRQRPKIDEYDTFYFMVVFAIDVVETPADSTGSSGGEPVAASSRVATHEIALFIGQRYLITVHTDPLPFIEQALNRWKHNSRAINEGIGVLVYTLLDGIVDAYFPVLDYIVERVEELEETLFTNIIREGKRYDMRSLFQIKKDLLQLRRVIAPERDALLVLARQEIPLFDRKVAVYFQDVYDHVVRVTDSIDIYQDLLTNALESYLSLISNNLNQVMKTLTSLTVILAVPTVIAGIYGMNFDNMPELGWTYGYPVALGMMALLALLIFLYFRRRGWI